MRPTGIVLLVLGILAAIAGFIAPGVINGIAVSTVASTDSTSLGKGTLSQLLNQTKLLSDPANPYDTDVPISSTRLTTGQTTDESNENNAVVFNTENTVVRDDTGEELSVSKAVFAFDGATSELVNCCGASVGDNTDVQFSGVMPLKWPFNVEQKDYDIFNTTLLAPVTATFVGTKNEYGMELYEFKQSIPATQTPAPPLSIPAALAAGVVGQLAPQLADQVPADGNVELYEFYTAENSFLVDPLTGQIVDGVVDDKTTFRLNGGTEDIVTKVAAVASGADPEASAADIKSSGAPLATAKTLIPVLFGLAVILAIIGIVLIVRGGRKKADAVTT